MLSSLTARAAAALVPLVSVALLTGSLRAASGEGSLAVQAGTIHTVSGDTITGGGTILIAEGKIVAVGQDLAIPPGTRVVDYGADAVIVPGLIDANSNLGSGSASQRTAAPDVRAIDNFDFYSTSGLYVASGGVTAVYSPPARGRLIAGQGAVVKVLGEGATQRTLSTSAALQGAISAEARTVEAFWEPPVPATVDVGMGEALLQLPRTTMGAILGLRELLALARDGRGAELYGSRTGPALAELLAAGTPWRIDAQSPGELRALLRFASSEKLPLIVETQCDAIADFAAELLELNAGVVYEVGYSPETSALDRPSARVAPRPTFDAPARLAEAGVKFAIATEDNVSSRYLLFAAGLASRGGLSPEHALRAITLDAAELLGVADRVGSLEPGKDADLCVLSGDPLSGSVGVIATLSAGQTAYAASETSSTVVISVEQLHVGDGHVLSPGELLIHDGKIAEVGARVSRPGGARVVRGTAAMPGMIDARGHLGLAGARKAPSPDFKLSRLVAPGDATDREVARAGVTTVLMAPRGENGAGVPFLAYKPAASSLDRMVIEDAAAVGLSWASSNPQKTGDNVRGVVGKALEYDAKWREYEQEIAQWVPPAEEPQDEKADDEADDDKEAEGDEGDDDKKKDDDEQEEDPSLDPLTGVWTAKLPLPEIEGTAGAAQESSSGDDGDGEQDKDKDKDKSDEGDDDKKKDDAKSSKKKRKKGKDDEQDKPGVPLEMSLVHEDGHVRGRLRCELLSDSLVRLEGSFEANELVLEGLGSAGWIDITAKLVKGKLECGVMSAGNTHEFEAERTASEVRRGQRPERRKVEVPNEREPRGKPRMPSVDEKLEPIRRALHGEAALVISVDEADQILECVDYFESLGVKPVLYGASDAWKLTDELAGRVAGVLLSTQVLRRDSRTGFESEINLYAALDNAGVPIAFHSLAESGAADIPLMAAFAVSEGLSPAGALRALTSGAAEMMTIDDRVGRLATGLDADVLLLDGSPLAPSTTVLRTWVAGEEVR